LALDLQGAGSVEPDDVFDLLAHARRVGAGKVDPCSEPDDFETGVDRR